MAPGCFAAHSWQVPSASTVRSGSPATTDRPRRWLSFNWSVLSPLRGTCSTATLGHSEGLEICRRSSHHLSRRSSRSDPLDSGPAFAEHHAQLWDEIYPALLATARTAPRLTNKASRACSQTFYRLVRPIAFTS
jgi:hypothetical protein